MGIMGRIKKRKLIILRYREQIPVPSVRAQVTITVEMINKHGLASFDTFGVSFNLQFHRTIKVYFLFACFICLNFINRFFSLFYNVVDCHRTICFDNFGFVVCK